MSTDLNSWLVNLKPFGLTKLDSVKKELSQKGLTVYDFTLGDPKEPTPNFIIDALKSNINPVSQYPTTIGSEALRASAVSWVKRRFKLNLNPATHVISSNGSKEAIFHIPQVLFNSASQKRMVVFPEPGYPVYKSGTILAGGVPYEMPLEASKNFVFDFKAIPTPLLSQIAAVWVCYPHNPTGALIDEETCTEIYEWALKNDIILLSDECYVDMFFEGGEPPVSFLQVAQKNNFKNLLCFFSLSKRSGMTGYRSGFVAGDETLLAQFAKYRLNVGLGTPDFVQNAAIAAWNDDAHVIDRNKIFNEKRIVVENFLTQNKIEFLKSKATFYIWAQIPASYSSADEFCAKLAQTTGCLATSGSAFGPHCSQYFRLALVPTIGEIHSCLKNIQNKIDSGALPL